MSMVCIHSLEIRSDAILGWRLKTTHSPGVPALLGTELFLSGGQTILLADTPLPQVRDAVLKAWKEDVSR